MSRQVDVTETVSGALTFAGDERTAVATAPGSSGAAPTVSRVDELRPSTEIISTWRKPVAVTACVLALGVMPHDRFMPTEPTDGYGYISGYNTGGTTSAASYAVFTERTAPPPPQWDGRTARIIRMTGEA